MSNEQIVNAPSLYINGLKLTNDATTPNSIIDVAAGICRDSTNVYDMNLGNFGGANPNISANTASTASIAVNGVNGLDTGTVAASTFYAVFVIQDPLNRPQYQPALLLSLSWTAPLMPQGYAIFRRIGAVLTDGSMHILLQYQSANNGNTRSIQYDAPIAVTVTASGTSTTYSNMDLSVAVPLVSFGRVKMNFKWTNNAASDTCDFTPAGGTGNYIIFTGQVASVPLTDQFEILPLIASSKPEVAYKVSAGTLNNVYVAAYEDLL